MTATIAEIREGLAANLQAVFSDRQVSAYMLAAPSPPAIDIIPDGITYDTAMQRGLDELHFIIRALVPATSDIGQQQNLDLMFDPHSPTSVKAAVEADRTLGGIVSSLRVEDVSAYKYAVPESGPPAFAVEFSVLVLN